MAPHSACGAAARVSSCRIRRERSTSQECPPANGSLDNKSSVGCPRRTGASDENRFVAAGFARWSQRNHEPHPFQEPPCPAWQVGEGASPSLDEGGFMPHPQIRGKYPCIMTIVPVTAAQGQENSAEPKSKGNNLKERSGSSCIFR